MESNREYYGSRLHSYETILNRGGMKKIQTKCFLQNLCITEYTHLQNFNEEVDIESFLPLSQILMSLTSYSCPTKGI